MSRSSKDHVLIAVDLDLLAAVLAVDDDVADLDVERDTLLAVVVALALADGDDLALLRLLLGGVGEDQTGLGLLLGLRRLDDHAIAQRLEIHRLPSYCSVPIRTPDTRPGVASCSAAEYLPNVRALIPRRLLALHSSRVPSTMEVYPCTGCTIQWA